MQIVTASAGPSSANLGYGFDVLALALESKDLPRDRVTVERANRWEVILEGADAERLPTDPALNVAAIAARSLTRLPLRVKIWKGLPAGSGLGSSAASAAAATLAVSMLLGKIPSRSRLTEAAAEGEKGSAGVAHADNVSAALFGGLICVTDTISSWPMPRHVGFALAIPKIELTTRKMRRVVPKSWSTAMHTRETARAIATAVSLSRGELDELAGVIRGSVVESRRSQFIPGYDAVVRAAEKAGAPAVTISGSGPSILAILDRRKTDAKKVAEAMAQAFEQEGISARAVVARCGTGARIEEAK